MQVITPEFIQRAKNAPTTARSSQTAGQQTDSGEVMDHFTFDMADSPFQSVLRTIEKLIDTDPREAMRLLKTTLSDRLFTADAQLSRLSQAMDEIQEELRRQKPEESFETAIALQSAFTRGMHSLPAPQAAASSATAPGVSQNPAAPGAAMAA